MKYSSYATILAILSGFLFSLSRADEVDDLVRADMALRKTPGIALAVTRNGRIEKLTAYGMANVENNVPVTTKTVFQIQSVTKSFVATAIMLLVQDGKLKVENKVSAYLDHTPDSWKDIALIHLLSHTSGIKDFINEPTASLRLEVTDDEVFKATSARPLNFAPGERYAYSNSNYHLLAMIIRRVTGLTYGEFLKLRVFDPLGMNRTRVMSWIDIIPGRASGYSVEGSKLHNGEFIAGSILAYGGGGLLSCVDDMVKWDLALRTNSIFPKTSLDRMWTPTPLNDGKTSNYGFGWGIGGKAPHRSVEHSGGHVTGFTSHIIRFTDDDLSVIVLANSGAAAPAKLARAVAGQYIPALKPTERKPIEDKYPKVTELLRTLEQGLREGRVNAAMFTPEMFTAITNSLESTVSELKLAGPLKSIELLDKKNRNGGTTEYLYRVRFQNMPSLVTMTLDTTGKVTGVFTEIE